MFLQDARQKFTPGSHQHISGNQDVEGSGSRYDIPILFIQELHMLVVAGRCIKGFTLRVRVISVADFPFLQSGKETW